MLNLEDINKAALKVKTGLDFPQFIQEIKNMGITRNDVYVSTGLSAYFDEKGHTVQSSPEDYPSLIINTISSAEKLKHALEVHQAGETDYFTFCKQAADAGVEKWVVDADEMTVSYLDIEGNELIKENISI